MSSPPSTPKSSSYLSHSTSSHSYSSPNLLTPSSSFTSRTLDYRVPGATTRPSTPLNFFSTPPSSKIHTMPLGASSTSLAGSSSAMSDSSDVLPRPSVDPAIKGVPQGWEDDPTIPVPPEEPPIPLPSTLPPQVPFPAPRSRSAFRPPLQYPPEAQHHTRLNSFRGLASLGETRSKLSSWKDKTFPELGEARRRRAGVGGAFEGRQGVSRPDQLRGGVTPRTSLDFSSSSTPSSAALPARLGVSVASHSQAPSTLANTIASDEDFADLFTTNPKAPSSGARPPPSNLSSYDSISTSASPPGGHDKDARSMTSTQSSSSTRNRERVLGLVPDPSRPNISSNASRLFLPPDVNDVLPFASSRLYSAWDHPQIPGNSASTSPIKANVRTVKGRRTSMSLSNPSEEGLPGGRFGSASTESGMLVSKSGAEETVEGWKDLPRPISGTGQKRIWMGPDGQPLASAYRVGWEKEVMDVEARLHEAMYDLAGERHTFIALEDEQDPKTVLDIGTGLGLWPVSQALLWRDTQFAGLDIVPSQLDLTALARAERIARSSSAGVPSEEGLWEGIEKRITWDQANFLTTLPYDTGVFDMVHLRFLSLGLSESAWPALLDEALRVLAPGGHIEIVDLSTTLPSSAPASLHRSFASMLMAEMINPDPSLPIQFALPMLDGLQSGMGRPVLEYAAGEEGVFVEAAWAWVRSALDYKGTGIEKAGGEDKGMVRRIKKGLGAAVGGMWGWEEVSKGGGEEKVSIEGEAWGEGPKVWAWVGRKKA